MSNYPSDLKLSRETADDLYLFSPSELKLYHFEATETGVVQHVDGQEKVIIQADNKQVALIAMQSLKDHFSKKDESFRSPKNVFFGNISKDRAVISALYVSCLVLAAFMGYQIMNIQNNVQDAKITEQGKRTAQVQATAPSSLKSTANQPQIQSPQVNSSVDLNSSPKIQPPPSVSLPKSPTSSDDGVSLRVGPTTSDSKPATPVSKPVNPILPADAVRQTSSPISSPPSTPIIANTGRIVNEPAAPAQIPVTPPSPQQAAQALTSANPPQTTTPSVQMPNVEMPANAEALQLQIEETKKVLELIKTQSSKLRPDQVKKLPHEIAIKMREMGVVMTDEEYAQFLSKEEAAQLLIVKIPNEIVEKSKDEFGIPSIPDANSWISNGQKVILPLPGGGEILSPSDFSIFGLKK